MGTLRRPYIAHVLIVCACSGADPSAGGSTIEGVHALESFTCNSGNCPEENTAGAALAHGHVWLTRDYRYCPNNGGNCGQNTTLHVGFVEAAFGPDGGVSSIDQTPDVQGPSASSGVGVAPDESVAYFAYTNAVKGLVLVQGFSDGADAGVAQVAQPGYITGVVADGRSAVVGVSTTSTVGGTETEQVDRGPGSILVTGGSGNKPGGALYRINLDDGGVSQQSASFDITVTHHLVASSGGSIYGIGYGTVWTAPVDLSAAPTTIGQIPPAQTGSACQTTNCISSGVGIDAANGVVAWSVLQGISVCNGPCAFESPSCSVWKNGASPTQSTRIYQSAVGCLGLGIDATYAYFALIETPPSTSCSGCGYDVVTTGIARVALNGPDTQQPTVVKLDSTRLFGPRRFFVDDTYVYGIDPAFVLRIPKSAFGP
jgi:hypothetical protein